MFYIKVQNIQQLSNVIVLVNFRKIPFAVCRAFLNRKCMA